MKIQKEAKRLLLKDPPSCDNCIHRNGYACFSAEEDYPLPESNICNSWVGERGERR
jgi:hypothetical protein